MSAEILTARPQSAAARSRAASSLKRGAEYPLLSEAEWERAAREWRREVQQLRASLMAQEAGRMAPLVWLVEQNAAFDLSAAWRDFGVPAAADEFSRYRQMVYALRERFCQAG